MKKSAIILVGGSSERFGQDKGLLKLINKPLIVHIVDRVSIVVDEILVVVNSKSPFIFLQLPQLGNSVNDLWIYDRDLKATLIIIANTISCTTNPKIIPFWKANMTPKRKPSPIIIPANKITAKARTRN